MASSSTTNRSKPTPSPSKTPSPKNPNERGAGATTSFSKSARKLLFPILATLTCALSSRSFLTSVPFYLWSTRNQLHSQPNETTTQWWTKFTIYHLCYTGLLFTTSLPLLYPLFGLQLTGWHALFLFLPSTTISLHDRKYQYSPLGDFVVSFFFDVPLLTAGFVCRELLGLRLFAPFCDILDDAIVQGSLPFPSDIQTLAGEPYNIGLIINMCLEYPGATAEMERFGIRQCRLPHRDTTAPSYESLVKGCRAIRDFRKEFPDKRVYVHCKGGIARASTMVLAHYVVNGDGEDPEVAIGRMKVKRPIVFGGVVDFPAIRELWGEKTRSGKGGM